MHAISIKEAKTQGLKFYFTGKPCKYGHIDKRRADTGNCIECAKIRYQGNPEIKVASAAYYAKNREKIIAYSAAYKLKNPDKIRAKEKKYREANRIKINLTKNKWKLANPEKVKASQRKYWLANKGYWLKYYAEYYKNNPQKKADRALKNKPFWRLYAQNRRARIRKNGGQLSVGLAEKLFKLQKGKCACCKKPLGNNYHMDHITPLAKGGANEDWNIQLLTQRCNNQKCAKDPVDFMQERGFLT